MSPTENFVLPRILDVVICKDLRSHVGLSSGGDWPFGSRSPPLLVRANRQVLLWRVRKWEEKKKRSWWRGAVVYPFLQDKASSQFIHTFLYAFLFLPLNFLFLLSFFLFTSSFKGFLRYTSYKVSIMTSSPTPDIFNAQPSQQRLNDTYDYDGSASGNGRQQYQFTSPPIQSHYNPLNMNPSPLKLKPLRGALPTVRLSRLNFLPFI